MLRNVLVLLALVVYSSSANSIEKQKRQILRAFDLSERPDFISQKPTNPYSLSRRDGLFGGVMDKLVVEAVNSDWHCQTPELLVADCFQFSFESIQNEVMSASLVLNTHSPNTTVAVYEVDELYGEMHYLDSIEVGHLEEGVGMEVKMDLTGRIKNWVKKQKLRGKMIKIQILSPIMPSLRLSDSLPSPPHFEITVFHANLPDSKCSSGCCVVPFYVNFTEIGWDDWILSPPGFYSNYCSGSCSADNDETYQFMKTSVSDASMLPSPTCVPNFYGSVDFIVALGPRDIRKTRLHGMRALSCSCS